MKHEIKPLTGIRGIAAVLVMVYHFCSYPAFADTSLRLMHRGYLCVDLFFILSGFVLALRHKDFFESGPLSSAYGSFLRARVARIYPAYFFFMLLYYAKWVFNMSGTNISAYRPGDIIANLLLVQSWGFPVRALVSDSWSVSTEAFAYLLFPLLLLFAVRLSLYFSVLLAGAAIGTLVLIMHTHYGVRGPLDAYRDDNSMLPLLRCLAGFSLGLVSYRISQLDICRKLLSGEKGILIILACNAAALLFDKTDLLTVLLFSPLIICLYYDNRISETLFGNRLAHHLGQVSYSLYLLHPFFIGVAGHYKSQTEIRFGSWPISFMLFGMGMTWFAAYLSYRLIERPGHAYVRRALSLHHQGASGT